ncbi:hypothetical protein [Lactococcus protaetiae]|uniref:Membrane-anchored protein n=1 Tax=Lactococcus protaetiae TaxID=2592653 RepID=A0A514Z9X3_9LACT|nr:hypothetical protein [Lactococcus protaetiae]QDK71347.1 hypothetical protein FLP15_09485 [Lactococcus protaetiae]
MLDKSFKWNKVPMIGLFFWLLKLVSTGQGESISDWSSQLFGQQNQIIGATFTVGWSLILFGVFIYMQIHSEKYRPIFYWLSVALLAVFGTILADGLSGVLGISHLFTTLIFAAGMVFSFLVWYFLTKSLSIHKITTLKAELCYWVTVMFSFAMGTALGDWFADTKGGYNPDPFGLGLGLLNTGLILGLIFLIVIAYRYFAQPRQNSISEILTFWIAYILTRPIGASFADYFGYDWRGGFLGNKGMSGIWLVIFITLMVITIVKHKKRERVEEGD